jgi:thiamine-monophosphate kinase
VFSKEVNSLKKIVARSGAESAERLGEHQIIQLMRNHFDIMPNLEVPFGDDISAVPLPVDAGQVAVLKADMLVGKTDVPRGMSLWQAARKAVVMNVSDFAAKGVEPKAALISLGLPKRLTRADFEEIAKGLNAGARQYGAYVVGGDTGEASDLIISVHLFGTTKKGTIALRSGARAGDIVAVTDFFGKSTAGLKILLGENIDIVTYGLRDLLLQAVFMPQARLKEGLALRKSGALTASIDSSDGLAWSLHELAAQSGVGFTITGLPVADEVKRFAEVNEFDATDLTLYGGEEYELVVTINPKLWAEAEKAVETVGGKLFPIGKATRDRQIILDIDGKKQPIKARGWEHFKSKY